MADAADDTADATTDTAHKVKHKSKELCSVGWVGMGGGGLGGLASFGACVGLFVLRSRRRR